MGRGDDPLILVFTPSLPHCLALLQESLGEYENAHICTIFMSNTHKIFPGEAQPLFIANAPLGKGTLPLTTLYL